MHSSTTFARSSHACWHNIAVSVVLTHCMHTWSSSAQGTKHVSVHSIQYMEQQCPWHKTAVPTAHGSMQHTIRSNSALGTNTQQYTHRWVRGWLCTHECWMFKNIHKPMARLQYKISTDRGTLHKTKYEAATPMTQACSSTQLKQPAHWPQTCCHSTQHTS